MLRIKNFKDKIALEWNAWNLYKMFLTCRKENVGSWIDKLKAEDTGFSSRFIYDKVKPQHEYYTWFLISTRAEDTPYSYHLIAHKHVSESLLLWSTLFPSISHLNFPREDWVHQPVWYSASL